MYIFVSAFKCESRGTKVMKIIKTKKMAKVIVEYGERQRIAAMFNTSLPTVRAALRGETNTALAKKIRAAAIKRGGVVAKQNNQ